MSQQAVSSHPFERGGYIVVLFYFVSLATPQRSVFRVLPVGYWLSGRGLDCPYECDETLAGDGTKRYSDLFRPSPLSIVSHSYGK